MRSVHAMWACRWLTCAFMLVGCGGGGGGGAGDGSASPIGMETQAPAAPGESTPAAALRVKFEPAEFQATYAENQTFRTDLVDNGRMVTARFNAEPASDLLPVLVQDQKVLGNVGVSFTRVSEGVYQAFLRYHPALLEGAYAGKLALVLCRDPKCAEIEPLEGGTLPYRITVTRGVRLSVWVNGVLQPAPWLAKARHGDILRIESSVPVSWDRVASSGAHPLEVQTTPTTWTGVARYSISTSGGVGSFWIRGSSKDPAASQGAHFEVTE